MDANTPLDDLPPAERDPPASGAAEPSLTEAAERDARRAENTAYNLETLRTFIELSKQLAALIVEDARTAATREPETPTRRTGHANDLNLLFRGVRRAVLLSEKLLAPPKPEPPTAPRKPEQSSPHQAHSNRPKTGADHLDSLDRLDTDPPEHPRGATRPARWEPPPLRPLSDAEKTLRICKDLNIKHRYGGIPLLERPHQEVFRLSLDVSEAIAEALKPFGLTSAGGVHPTLPPNSS